MYLHKNGIVHQRLNPMTIWIDSNNNYCPIITDFGISATLNNSSEKYSDETVLIYFIRKFKIFNILLIYFNIEINKKSDIQHMNRPLRIYYLQKMTYGHSVLFSIILFSKPLSSAKSNMHHPFLNSLKIIWKPIKKISLNYKIILLQIII